MSNDTNDSDNELDPVQNDVESDAQSKHTHRQQRIRTIISDQNFGFYDQPTIDHDDLSIARATLELIEDITHQLPRHSQPLFKPSRIPPQEYRINTSKDRQAYRVLSALNKLPDLLEMCSQHRFNPYVESFLDLAHRFELEGISMDEVLDRSTINTLNDFVEEVIEDTQSEGFRHHEQRCREKVARNRKELLRYIDRLFNLHSRLLVIRIDFGYQKSLIHDLDQPLNISRVLKDKEKLIRYAKRVYGDALEGYVWKLEKGILKSYHYHMLFLMNGREKHGDIAIGQQLGQYWNETIVKGEGTYFNCNAQNYHNSGIGMIRFEDEKRDHLERYVIDYLVKPDYDMQLLVRQDGALVRTLGKGLMPPEPDKVRRGRSRG